VEAGGEPRVQAQVVPLSQVNATPAQSAPAAPAAPVEIEPEPTEEERQFAAWQTEAALRKAMAAVQMGKAA